MFHKILIANRAEIACRVMRTARRMGYRTVAVYSEADAQSPHVALADEAVCIGPPAAALSYLSIHALLDAAKKTGADAVHPGYGFLSERADFAQACADAGLVFIGPPPAAIRAMGDKALAKRRMLEAGVPCAPGYLGDDQSDDRLMQEAQRLGFPLLVKAVAGGGGRGMRLVRDASEVAPGARGRAPRGRERVRRRHADARAADRTRQAHRDPGVRRCARPRDPPRRARLQRAAPATEGDRRSALTGGERRDARGDGRATRWPRRAPWAMWARARWSSSSTMR